MFAGPGASRCQSASSAITALIGPAGGGVAALVIIVVIVVLVVRRRRRPVNAQISPNSTDDEKTFAAVIGHMEIEGSLRLRGDSKGARPSVLELVNTNDSSANGSKRRASVSYPLYTGDAPTGNPEQLTPGVYDELYHYTPGTKLNPLLGAGSNEFDYNVYNFADATYGGPSNAKVSGGGKAAKYTVNPLTARLNSSTTYDLPHANEHDYEYDDMQGMANKRIPGHWQARTSAPQHDYEYDDLASANKANTATSSGAQLVQMTNRVAPQASSTKISDSSKSSGVVRPSQNATSNQSQAKPGRVDEKSAIKPTWVTELEARKKATSTAQVQAVPTSSMPVAKKPAVVALPSNVYEFQELCEQTLKRKSRVLDPAIVELMNTTMKASGSREDLYDALPNAVDYEEEEVSDVEDEDDDHHYEYDSLHHMLVRVPGRLTQDDIRPHLDPIKEQGAPSVTSSAPVAVNEDEKKQEAAAPFQIRRIEHLYDEIALMDAITDTDSQLAESQSTISTLMMSNASVLAQPRLEPTPVTVLPTPVPPPIDALPPRRSSVSAIDEARMVTAISPPSDVLTTPERARKRSTASFSSAALSAMMILDAEFEASKAVRRQASMRLSSSRSSASSMAPMQEPEEPAPEVPMRRASMSISSLSPPDLEYEVPAAAIPQSTRKLMPTSVSNSRLAPISEALVPAPKHDYVPMAPHDYVAMGPEDDETEHMPELPSSSSSASPRRPLSATVSSSSLERPLPPSIDTLPTRRPSLSSYSLSPEDPPLSPMITTASPWVTSEDAEKPEPPPIDTIPTRRDSVVSRDPASSLDRPMVSPLLTNVAPAWPLITDTSMEKPEPPPVDTIPTRRASVMSHHRLAPLPEDLLETHPLSADEAMPLPTAVEDVPDMSSSAVVEAPFIAPVISEPSREVVSPFLENAELGYLVGHDDDDDPDTGSLDDTASSTHRSTGYMSTGYLSQYIDVQPDEEFGPLEIIMSPPQGFGDDFDDDAFGFFVDE